MAMILTTIGIGATLLFFVFSKEERSAAFAWFGLIGALLLYAAVFVSILFYTRII